MGIFAGNSGGPKASGRIASFVYGISLPVQAFRLIIGKPALILWSLLPISITIVLYVQVISRLQEFVTTWMSDKIPSLGVSADGWFAMSLMILVKVLLILVSAVTFSVVATIIASPFNDFLAESSEKWIEPRLPPPVGSGWGMRTRLILIDLGKTIAATAATICALLLAWVPLVGFLSALIAALLVCFQYISYAQTRRGVGLGGGLAFLWRHLFACAGFGAVISVLFAIPLASSLALPLAVVGGTILVARAPGSSALGRLR